MRFVRVDAIQGLVSKETGARTSDPLEIEEPSEREEAKTREKA